MTCCDCNEIVCMVCGSCDGGECPKGQWINVKNRLPELHQDVLIWGKDYNDTQRILIGSRWHEAFGKPDGKNKYIDNSLEGLSIYDVEYWIPLPSAPKEKK